MPMLPACPALSIGLAPKPIAMLLTSRTILASMYLLLALLLLLDIASISNACRMVAWSSGIE
eukprot:308233-Rhodomonas_salina.2